MVLTAVTKFRVSFGEVVDMERNFATMELMPPRTCDQKKEAFERWPWIIQETDEDPNQAEPLRSWRR